MSKFYGDRSFCFLGRGSSVFKISWKRVQQRFDCEIQGQKLVKLQEKSALNFGNILFWGWITKLFTYFLNISEITKFNELVNSGKAFCQGLVRNMQW